MICLKGDRIIELLSKIPENIALCCTEIAGAIGWGREAIYKALQRLSQRGILTVRPSTTDPRHKVYRLAVNMGDTPPQAETQLSNIIPESVKQLTLDDIGHSLDNCIGHSREGTPELSNQIETTVTTDVGQALDNGVGQIEGTHTTTDAGQTLDNYVGHNSESREGESDETLVATDIGQTLDNGVGHEGESVDSINMESVTNQVLILSHLEIDADALEYLTEGWTNEFKQAVYDQLSEETRSRLREIMRS
ncbi:MAG: hypothetical protein DSM106950_44815 [Stigonema ocellatum SAG 48.90 = DSM 106950]|nr:hypothetical protein [Stigonema ocellatum SAG 48.90 = DSM 106950]